MTRLAALTLVAAATVAVPAAPADARPWLCADGTTTWIKPGIQGTTGGYNTCAPSYYVCDLASWWCRRSGGGGGWGAR